MTTTPSVLTRYHTDQINRLASALGMLGETSEDVVTEAMKRIAATGEAVAWADPADVSEERDSICATANKWKHPGTRYTMPLYAAPQPASVADGWVLVPVVPTEAMVEAGIKAACKEDLRWNDLNSDEVYAAMIEAARGAGG